MSLRYIQLCIFMVLLCAAPWAQAKLTCTTPVSTGFSTAYAPTGVVPNVTQGMVTFTCKRTKATDATSVILLASNGLNVSGSQNRTKRGTARISYEAYKDSACSTVWSNNSTATAITVPLLSPGGLGVSESLTVNYWGCITLAGQVVAAGNYTDTVTVSVRNVAGTTSYASGTFPVSITNPATCTMTTNPGW